MPSYCYAFIQYNTDVLVGREVYQLLALSVCDTVCFIVSSLEYLVDVVG
jgi:hypothetical protein